MPNRAEFLAKLNAFLDTPCRAEGGSWPEVSDDDMKMLWALVGELVDLKFERDCDGDSVIDIVLTDRSRYEKPLYLPIPWASKRAGDGEAPDLELRIEAAERHSLMAKHHQERSSQELRSLQMLMVKARENHTPVQFKGLEYRVPVPVGVTLESVKTAAQEAVAERVAEEAFPVGFSEGRAWAEKTANRATEKAGVLVLARTAFQGERDLRVFMDVPSFNETIRVIHAA